jgi:atypical dual specificity phosphatase
MSGSPSQILPFLYLGDYLDARNFEKLRKLGVTRILNVSDSARNVDEPEIGFCHIPISDYGETHLPAVFERCFEFISKAKSEGRTLLAHCRHGQNRSPAVVIGYLVQLESLSLREAYTLVARARPRIGVHEIYFEQLRELERRKTGENTLTQDDIGPNVQEFLRTLQRNSDE